MEFKIFIAEDDIWYGELLQYHLSLNPDYKVSKFTTGEALLSKMSEVPDIVSLDYSLPDMNGGEILDRIKVISPSTDVVIVSGQEDVGTAIDLLKKGAYDYLVKNEETKDRLWNTISRIKENRALKKEVAQLRKEVVKKYDFSKTIIGSSSGIKKVFSLMEKASKTNINVSIVGETGTGKELIAKAIHYNSDRRKQPFVAFNVSAVPSELIESELFGHEKGAFTGAVGRRIGKFEEAENGTLFLDEIGEMDQNMQAKLLRVLQERELTRVGGSGTIKITCRIISATHRDLLKEVNTGNFRQDLYFRLIGLPVELPPLRERKEDLILLTKHFIEKFAKENDYTLKKLSEVANGKLLKYSFPGNVRELKAIIDLAMVMSDEDTIESEHIQFHQSDPVNDLSFSEMTLRNYNYKILQYFLQKYNNNVLKVANILDIGKSTIYRMLKEQPIQQYP